jgi:cyclophilin family peptidyl-prolyl cis-trans isomerase
MTNRLFLTLGMFMLVSLMTTSHAQTKKKPQPVANAKAKTTSVKKNTPSKKMTDSKSTNPTAEIPGKTKVKIHTDMGDIVIRLYDSTPKHRDNFVKLVKEKFYDSLLFHRVIQNFMVQGGDPMSKSAQPGSMLGMGGGDMDRIPAEFNKQIIHKKGALAAARDGNPEKASSACQFYLVQGNPINDEMLNMLEQQKGIKYTTTQRNTYKSQGGTPFLDMDYSVFGEVVSGLEVVDKIASVDKNQYDRPNIDVRMYMELMPE